MQAGRFKTLLCFAVRLLQEVVRQRLEHSPSAAVRTNAQCQRKGQPLSWLGVGQAIQAAIEPPRSCIYECRPSETNAPSPEHESEKIHLESGNREGRVENWKEPSQKIQAKYDNYDHRLV